MLRGLKPAPPGKRLVVWDVGVPSLHIRVTDKGVASFNIMRRIKGCRTPVRRHLGISRHVPFPAGIPLPYGLAQAREDARVMIISMSRGVDPRGAIRKADSDSPDTFGVIAELFIKQHVSGLKSAHEVEADFRRLIIPMLGRQPIAQISRRDIINLLEGLADRPYVARHVLAYVSRCFSWAIARDRLSVSPCTGIKIADIAGRALPRQRVLSDAELRAVWTAAGTLGDPLSAFVHTLILTGQRLREVAQMTWGELDFEKSLWVVPAARMKGGAAHEVPLAAASVRILRELPRLGDAIFTIGGDRPIAGFDRVKSRLDALLPGMDAWRFHDLRRTMRTGLGGLPVPNNVAELCIAHTMPGMHKVYDRHSYREEKRKAFELWAARVAEVVGC